MVLNMNSFPSFVFDWRHRDYIVWKSKLVDRFKRTIVKDGFKAVWIVWAKTKRINKIGLLILNNECCNQRTSLVNGPGGRYRMYFLKNGSNTLHHMIVATTHDSCYNTWLVVTQLAKWQVAKTPEDPLLDLLISWSLDPEHFYSIENND